MRMIPSQPLRTESQAEKLVFDQLRYAFSHLEDSGGWFAMHSLNLPLHAYKRFGEIDFLLCGPEGLFVLEVKGGGISCHNGIWTTQNRYGIIEQLRESPFKQANDALHGLLKKMPKSLWEPFVTGYGVVIPNTNQVPLSSEWDKSVLADSKNFKQFSKWLEGLIQHWRNKGTQKDLANLAQIDAIRQYLRPNFESVQTLHRNEFCEIQSHIAKLTQDQLKFIDIAEVNSRVICAGGAGTGKTMLALELAKRWVALGLKVALTCHSMWLKNFLESKSIIGLIICQTGNIRIAAKRHGIDKFDAIIVDEGQDVLNEEDLNLLESVLKGGLSQGKWCFFHDINNQTGLCGDFNLHVYQHLEQLCTTKIPLKTNCRNTLPILNRIQDVLYADTGNAGVTIGSDVREKQTFDCKELTKILENELRYLLDQENFTKQEIVILSPKAFQASSAVTLPLDLKNAITILDESSPRYADRNKIGFAEIQNFKGLESNVIILIDLPRPEKNIHLHSLHYVGMSRARVLLSLIYKL